MKGDENFTQLKSGKALEQPQDCGGDSGASPGQGGWPSPVPRFLGNLGQAY